MTSTEGAEASGTAGVATEETGSTAVRRGSSVLFGRGLLYVVVWSMQLVVSSLVSPVLAHLMPPAEFGVLASAIALYQALVVVAVAGIDQASVLQRAEDGDDRRARGLLTVGIVTAGLVTAAALVTIPLWAMPPGSWASTPSCSSRCSGRVRPRSCRCPSRCSWRRTVSGSSPSRASCRPSVGRSSVWGSSSRCTPTPPRTPGAASSRRAWRW
ncbi:oligosaccharide flippase family protein [Curtobacterium flaccumfaciens]|nr:oligosaccharide flippase family protein [Curtobacterium flaccumfaciens]